MIPWRLKTMQANSCYLLGRKPARERFEADGVVVLSAYSVTGQPCLRYTGPVTQPACKSKPTVKYRIRLTRKKSK